MLLKHKIRLDALNDENLKLDLFSVSCHDYYEDAEKVEVRVEHRNDIELYPEEELLAQNSIDKNDNYGNLYPVYSSETIKIVQCNNIEKTFSFIADKYQRLLLNGVWLAVEDNVLYLHFSFDEWHFFRSWDTYGIDFTIMFVDDALETEFCTFSGCEYVNEKELRWRYDATFGGIEKFMCYVFRNDRYVSAGFVDDGDEILEQYVEVHEIPDTACFTDELHLRVRVELQKEPLCVKWALYDKECNDGTVSGLSARRPNYKFKDVNYVDFYVTIPLASLHIPISVETGNDTYQEQNINDNFVMAQEKRSKNSIVEMEKLVYHPVRAVDVYGGGRQYKPLKRIRFNLHFREREQDGWIVKQDGLWNGMRNRTGNETGYMYGNVTDTDVVKYYSYMPNVVQPLVDRGCQSDLLTYLGFTDTDVKYQKSRLKKSFLRLSFYDSPNRANQNLLSYSTVFMDTGNLFAKMMRGASKKNEYVKSGQTSNSLRYDDLKVNTEPCLQNHTSYSIEDIEKQRLSSQIVVADKFSESSSEGFYLYLWADEDNGSVPSDVYMRVEFNHAGYGRVVPMTMPYLGNSNNNHIYSMDEIFDIWNEHNGWGIRTNEKYSYIHFRYVYDSETQKHVYFLDPDTYGAMPYNNMDEMDINLYEPKINFQ